MSLDHSDAVAAIAALMDRVRKEAGRTARGAVTFCLIAPDLPGEVEVTVGEDLPVSPQVRGALKSLPGVVMVEDL